MEVKTSELTVASLNYCIAMAKGGEPTTHHGAPCIRWPNGAVCDARPIAEAPGDWIRVTDYCTDWSKGGPLIADYSITFLLGAEKSDDKYFAVVGKKGVDGPTHLIAACRAIVSVELGDTVTVPDELQDFA